MTEQISNLKKIRILGYEWHKASDRAPFKISATDMSDGTAVDLVFWGKTHPGKVEFNQEYEVEINKSALSSYSNKMEFTLSRTPDKHGISHMIKKNGDKVEPIEDLKIIKQEITKIKIMVVDKFRAVSSQLHSVKVRDLDSEFVEDAKMFIHGSEIPDLKDGDHYEILGTRQESNYGLHIQFKKLISHIPNPLQSSKITQFEEVEIKDVLDDVAPIFRSVFDALQEDSLNYVPGYKTYRASSANECLRKILLKKWESDFSSKTRKLISEIRRAYNYERDRTGATWVGTAIHEYAENVMKKAEIYVSSEEKIRIDRDGFILVGHYDLLLEIDGQRYVADIKTTNPKYTGSQWEFKLEDHFKQLTIYQHHFGGIPGLIIYIERNSGKVTVFKNEYSEDVFNKVAARFRKLSEYEERHELPMVSGKYHESNFPCKKGEWQCEYWHVCWRNAK